ncbi:DUF3018 family protein [Roseiarcaceae bacterium H3SJ34-1]|uniref:antitoxin MazE-like protein n=1 Tax=Terripilifer ovatus TaxID=3032367 RepID=UPI003AB93E96|nr:DUF3018 family protein [Roseiarcaceae bacterium H3SJ34-1]
MTTAERMKAMRGRRRTVGLREVRLHLPDTRVASVRKRIASQVAKLGRVNEEDALRWIEAVSEFDADATR